MEDLKGAEYIAAELKRDGKDGYLTIHVLIDKIKDLQEQLEQKNKAIQEMVAKAATKHRPAYDEQQRKILALTLRNEKLEQSLLKAKESFEQSESPFYEGMKILNQVNKALKE